MKKLKTLTIFLSFLLASANLSAAESGPYIGVGYQGTNINLNQTTISGFNVELEDYVEDTYSAPAVFIGYNFTKQFGAEVGYFSQSEEKSNSNTGLVWSNNGNPFRAKTNTKLQIINLDGIYSQELVSGVKGLIIGSVNKIDSESKINYLDNAGIRLSEKISDNGVGIGAGLGLEIKLIQNLNIRFTGKYIGSNNDNFDNLITYSAAIKYNF